MPLEKGVGIGDHDKQTRYGNGPGKSGWEWKGYNKYELSNDIFLHHHMV